MLQVWFKYPQDFETAITEIIEAGGDADTTAALLGGLIGVNVGEENIPEQWVTQIKDAPISMRYLRTLSEVWDGALHKKIKHPNSICWMFRNILFTTTVLTHGLFRLIPKVCFRK